MGIGFVLSIQFRERLRMCREEYVAGHLRLEAKFMNTKLEVKYNKLSVQFSSVAQSCPTLCDTMNCRTPGLPVHHQLLEFTQTHVH